MKSLMNPLIPLPILNYTPCRKTPYALYYFGLGGLKTWICHSDCDGYYSPGDCSNMIEIYERIKNHFGDSESQEELIEVFRDSVDTKSYITFS
jgi:hypothetical protein